MKSILQLNLQSDSETAASLPKPQREEPESQQALKRLNQMANRIAHKGASQYGRSTSSIFSK